MSLGDTLIAFAVLHVFFYAIFWGPTPYVMAFHLHLFHASTSFSHSLDGYISASPSRCESAQKALPWAVLPIG